MLRLLTNKELQELLQVSDDTIRKYRRDKFDPLPFMKVGQKEYRYDLSKILKWLDRQGRRIETPERFQDYEGDISSSSL